jgi:hypothetical protein
LEAVPRPILKTLRRGMATTGPALASRAPLQSGEAPQATSSRGQSLARGSAWRLRAEALFGGGAEPLAYRVEFVGEPPPGQQRVTVLPGSSSAVHFRPLEQPREVAEVAAALDHINRVEAWMGQQSKVPMVPWALVGAEAVAVADQSVGYRLSVNHPWRQGMPPLAVWLADKPRLVASFDLTAERLPRRAGPYPLWIAAERIRQKAAQATAASAAPAP